MARVGPCNAPDHSCRLDNDARMRSLRVREIGRYNAPALKQNPKPGNPTSAPAEVRVKTLSGILLPLPTPFDGNDVVDTPSLCADIENWNKTGIAGYVLLGSTGERAHLGEHECLNVIESARENVPDAMLFIVGAGQQSTRATIDEVRRVATAGSEAMLVITPHFYRAEMTQNVLINHYLAVADASPVPVLLYSIPQLTGVTLAPETIATLSAHENIIGVKDSSGDILALAETVRQVPEDFAVLTGSGSALYPALCIGARGGILAIGCIAPRLAVEVYEAFQTGEHESARKLQQRLTTLTRGILGRYGISGLKVALDMLGYSGGKVRAPLQDASEEARRTIAAILNETGLMASEADGDEYRLAGASIR